MLQKGSKKGVRKAAPAPRRAFESNFEDRSKLEGKRLPKKTPKSHASVVESGLKRHPKLDLPVS